MNKLHVVLTLSLCANLIFGVLMHRALIIIHALESKIKKLQKENFSMSVHEIKDENDIVL